MKDQLAEQLLAKVMGWKSPEEFVRDGFLRGKYLRLISTTNISNFLRDAFHREPGSVARAIRYHRATQDSPCLCSQRLVFISSVKMNDLVSISYPDHIRPLLLSKAAAEAGLPKWHLAKVASSLEYRVRKRKCLFLGLSDGSHTDVFRRSNPQRATNRFDKAMN